MRLLLVSAAIVMALISSPPASADPVPACDTAQLIVRAGHTDAGATHRAVTIGFALQPDAPSCTLTGYPGVDTGTGGPLLHARRTLRGYMGGLPPGSDMLPVVELTSSSVARAVVEGRATDDAGNQCPTYTELVVTPPDSTDSVLVPASIDTCALEVHPVVGAPRFTADS